MQRGALRPWGKRKYIENEDVSSYYNILDQEVLGVASDPSNVVESKNSSEQLHKIEVLPKYVFQTHRKCLNGFRRAVGFGHYEAMRYSRILPSSIHCFISCYIQETTSFTKLSLIYSASPPPLFYLLTDLQDQHYTVMLLTLSI